VSSPTPYLPPSSHSTDSVSPPQTTRRYLLIRRPTPQCGDDLDIKPYSTLIPRPMTTRGDSRAGTPSFTATPRPTDVLASFGKFRMERGDEQDVSRLIASSDLRHHNQTAKILSVLRVRNSVHCCFNLFNSACHLPALRSHMSVFSVISLLFCGQLTKKCFCGLAESPYTSRQSGKKCSASCATSQGMWLPVYNKFLSRSSTELKQNYA
jgi:hypothetical protein